MDKNEGLRRWILRDHIEYIEDFSLSFVTGEGFYFIVKDSNGLIRVSQNCAHYFLFPFICTVLFYILMFSTKIIISSVLIVRGFIL